jgi:hypothetical protein
MGRRKKRKPDDANQSAKFIELAKQLNPVTEETFQDAFTRVAKADREEVKPKSKKKTNQDTEPP